MTPLDPPSDAELAADITALVKDCGGVVPAASVAGVSHQRVSQWQSPHDAATPNYKQLSHMQHFAKSRAVAEAMLARLEPKSEAEAVEDALQLVCDFVRAGAGKGGKAS